MITGKYLQFYKELQSYIPKKRLLHDSLSTLAFGIDASFYRLIPKLIVKVHNEQELENVIKKAYEHSIPITFKAAGTSLSGQTISDSVIVIASHGWKKHEIYDNGNRIKLQAGIIGARANLLLKKYGKKIGPDPASIDSCMIGGIASNNASGMNSGIMENSYSTVSEIRVVLSDGTILDTSSQESCNSFRKTHSQIISKLEKLAKRVKENSELKAKIEHKYRIKNTTGYGINSLVDYSDGIDIIKHLLIGSEGTLGFISDITYKTLDAGTVDPHNALSLIIFPDIVSACNAVIKLKKQKVSAAEIMDRAALRSVDSVKGVPSYLKTLQNRATALLVETTAQSKEALEKQIEGIKESITEIKTELPIEFTTDPQKQNILWKVRKEIFATVAGMRKSGTTPLIEDLCFPLEKLSSAASDLIKIIEKYNYKEAAIWGHAKDGNLHFVFTQDFQTPKEVERYNNFMSEIITLTVDKYDGSLKAEHGTGRNMAPFVRTEWGEEAYTVMKEIKEIMDPKEILNPGVLINEDPTVHIKNLKPTPSIRESVDMCMECGFCESICVSEGLTLSPRQRITVYREIERLKQGGLEPHRLAELQKLYKYAGLDTCATDGLCFIKCPLDIDTGKLVKELRHEAHSPRAEKVALSIAKNMDKVTAGMRFSLSSFYYLRLVTGKKLFGTVAGGVHKISGGIVPLWNEYFPKGTPKISNKVEAESLVTLNKNSTPKGNNLKVVYFPSCITRSMGQSKGKSNEPNITEITKTLLERAGYTIIYPEQMNSLCCGMAFSSKGYVKAGEEASNKLEQALHKASQGGKIPILCDMSPCLYTMQTNFGERLKLYEPAEFLAKYVMDKLAIKQLDKKISIFAVCSAKKMEVENYLYQIAKQCAKEVVVIDSNCCGFAGDRGFIVPELNKHGLRNLAHQSKGCSEGYATSKTCEIGLSNHSGIEFSSIMYLVEEASRID
ncbi:MAG: FAD-binding and (Fe-S)-binding domain-containing protein [Bacteroidales bacterium]|nr:FAD-binding and (Fe-S)-binding domain-containing protein [Bacteroidales bacterium]